MKKMSHSQSTRVDKADDDDDIDSGNQKIVKRSSSFFFDPTTKVSTPLPDLIWKMAFHRLPKSPQLAATTLSNDQVIDLLHCGLLSNAVYYKSSKRHLPPNLSNIVYECTVSDYYRVPYFVINSDELNTIFIAFRGSACLEDWHVDFLAAAIQFERGHVHEGVYFTALNIFNDFKEQIRDLAKKRNNRPIIITGHSLGGAVAGMMSILFKQEMPTLNVRAICLAPVACLSPEIWEISSSYIRSYINYGDLVPFISYYNTYYLPENSLPKLTHDQLVNWCLKKINKHSKRPEFRLLVDTYTQPVTVPYKLVPPGISCLIRIVDKKAAKVEIQSIDDQFSYFGQFVKNLSALKHPIKFYKHSIIRFFCDFFNQDEELINYYSLAKKKKSIRIPLPFRRRKHRKHNHPKKEEKDDNDKESSNESVEKNGSSVDDSDNKQSKNSSSTDNDNDSKQDENEEDENEDGQRSSSSEEDDDDEEDEDDDENNENYNDVDDNEGDEKYYKYE
ncbi:hypothetical protein M9Y10_018393 [Tritrichomonas musculus]|uniref:sn-1-specific diacylglycerol lipase n=1 Tax=Tritrichomonas musculus TaxID=1915356 RepID=A0ABR2HNF7_9EUKA